MPYIPYLEAAMYVLLRLVKAGLCWIVNACGSLWCLRTIPRKYWYEFRLWRGTRKHEGVAYSTLRQTADAIAQQHPGLLHQMRALDPDAPAE